jgi:hypothetical protein
MPDTNDEDENEQLQRTTWALFNLCINLGLISSVIDQYPPHVQDNFQERLKLIEAQAQVLIEETQSFGEAFDDETEA